MSCCAALLHCANRTAEGKLCQVLISSFAELRSAYRFPRRADNDYLILEVKKKRKRKRASERGLKVKLQSSLSSIITYVHKKREEIDNPPKLTNKSTFPLSLSLSLSHTHTHTHTHTPVRLQQLRKVTMSMIQFIQCLSHSVADFPPFPAVCVWLVSYYHAHLSCHAPSPLLSPPPSSPLNQG